MGACRRRPPPHSASHPPASPKPARRCRPAMTRRSMLLALRRGREERGRRFRSSALSEQVGRPSDSPLPCLRRWPTSQVLQPRIREGSGVGLSPAGGRARGSQASVVRGGGTLESRCICRGCSNSFGSRATAPTCPDSLARSVLEESTPFLPSGLKPAPYLPGFEAYITRDEHLMHQLASAAAGSAICWHRHLSRGGPQVQWPVYGSACWQDELGFGGPSAARGCQRIPLCTVQGYSGDAQAAGACCCTLEAAPLHCAPASHTWVGAPQSWQLHAPRLRREASSTLVVGGQHMQDTGGRPRSCRLNGRQRGTATSRQAGRLEAV